jgi:hypothetical protein
VHISALASVQVLAHKDLLAAWRIHGGPGSLVGSFTVRKRLHPHNSAVYPPRPFVFETSVVKSKVGTLVRAVQALNVGNWIGWTITGLQGYYPMYVTARRL